MSSDLKFGKTAARPEAVKFKFANYADKKVLPKPPRSFGHEASVPKTKWGMLANDQYGCCVLAGAAHESMLWTRMSKTCPDSEFSEAGVLAAYADITGFKPSDPATDNGTDMKDAASYRRKVGILDKNNERHKIAAYLSIDPTNLTEHYQALYLFGALGIGIQCPSNVIDQFDAGKAWSVTKGTKIEGGHYVPLVARRNTLMCVTWGKTQGMTAGFFGKYNDESIAYLSEEMLENRKSPEGFDYDALLADLNSLK
ncbi:MAG: hypothetical protein JWN75_1193 [Candidatus Saccharibacteria bacterium]|nr:hypothetical protein [Candidatus Saccharibacteria bacterium]